MSSHGDSNWARVECLVASEIRIDYAVYLKSDLASDGAVSHVTDDGVHMRVRNGMMRRRTENDHHRLTDQQV